MSKKTLIDDAELNTKRELLYQGMTNAFGKVRMSEQIGKCKNIDDVTPEDKKDDQ
jgi:hypothetical protein